MNQPKKKIEPEKKKYLEFVADEIERTTPPIDIDSTSPANDTEAKEPPMDWDDYLEKYFDKGQPLVMDKSYYNVSVSEYNFLADLLRKQNKYEKAIAAVNEGLEKYPNDGYLLGTKAEIYGAMKNEELFFDYVESAMKNGCPIWEFLNDQVYKPYKDKVRFINLIKKFKFK